MYYANFASNMPAQSVEEELAELAALVEEAERLGFDHGRLKNQTVRGQSGHLALS